MANYKKLGKDVLLMTIGSFGSRVISFVFVPFYTAVLTTEEYGISDLVTTTATLLLPLFTLTVFESMMRFALDKGYDPQKIWQVGCKVEVIGILVFLVLSPIILLTVLKDYYIFVIAYYLMMSINRCVSYFVRGINKVKVFAISGTLQTAMIVGLSILFLLVFKIGIVGYLLAHIFASFIASGYMLIAAKVYKYGFKIKGVDKQLQKEMLAYSVPMMPNSVCWWIANASDRYILTAFVGTAATGIYSIAYKIPTIVSALTSIFGNAWKLSAVDDFGSEKSKNFFSDIFSKMTVLMVLAASFLMVINKPLASILFSKDFYQAWRCVPILLMASVMHAYSEFLGSIYTSAYKTKFLVFSTAVGSIVNIVLNLILIPVYHGMGAAIATLIGYAVIWLTRVFHSRSIMKIEYHLIRDIFCYILIGVQIFIACNSFSNEYIISGALFASIFVLMHKEVKSLFCMIFKRWLPKDRVIKENEE